MQKITDIKARMIINSRGTPAVEVDVITDSGVLGRSSSPSGASVGKFEALELYDKDSDFNGKGVKTAINNINTIIKPALLGKDPEKQNELDILLKELDGTQQLSKLGGNTILSTSLAVSKAAALSRNLPYYRYINLLTGNKPEFSIPIPMFNILNGGAHADNTINIQEFMLIPKGIAEYNKQLKAGVEIYHTLKSLLKDRKLSTGVGDEGGFAPSLESDVKAIELIVEAISKAGYKPGVEVFLGLDVAITQFTTQVGDKYTYKFDHQGEDGSLSLISQEEIIKYYVELTNKYPIISIEDGLAEDDWLSWPFMTKALQLNNTLCVGDDFIVTNPDRLKRAIESNAISALIIKPNQVGTLSDVLTVTEMCKKAGIKRIVSHRSGETEDIVISHLGVATNSEFMKHGAPCRGERIEEYNELLRIEEELHYNS